MVLRLKGVIDLIHARTWFRRTACLPPYLVNAERDDIEQRLRHHFKEWYGYCPPDHLLLKSVAEVEQKHSKD